MPNEYVNKVVRATGEIEIDLSLDTVSESDVAIGKTFHKADGSPAIGIYQAGEGVEFTNFPLEYKGLPVYQYTRMKKDSGATIRGYAYLEDDIWTVTTAFDKITNLDGSPMQIGDELYMMTQARDEGNETYAIHGTLTRNLSYSNDYIYITTDGYDIIEGALREQGSGAGITSNFYGMSLPYFKGLPVGIVDYRPSLTTLMSWATDTGEEYYVSHIVPKKSDGSLLDIGDICYLAMQVSDTGEWYALKFQITREYEDSIYSADNSPLESVRIYGRIASSDVYKVEFGEMREAPAVALSAPNALRMITGGYQSNLGGSEIPDEDALNIITGGEGE